MAREPWIKVKIGIFRSGKIAGLPNDTARLGWFKALVESKVQRRMGVYDNRAHFVEVIGRFGKYFDQYVAQTLVEIAPDLCVECKRRNRGLRRGQVVVHDFLREQRDPTNADRQADYRATHGGRDEPEEEPEKPADDVPDEPPRNGDRNADHNGDRNAHLTPEQPQPESGQEPSLAPAGAWARDRAGTRAGEADAPQTGPPSTTRNGDRNAETGATVTALSRARATTATATVTNLSTGRDSSSLVPGAPVERDDIAALLERGWRKVTKAQRRVLDEVLARHDVTGPAFAAEAIRMTPPDADPLAAVMDADRRWQAAQRAQADAAEQDWNETKAAERNGAGASISSILANLPEPELGVAKP